MKINVLFSFLLLFFSTLTLSAQEKTKLKEGDKSPDFMACDINGKQVTVESLKGKYIYIDVWATWCGPCMNEIPHMKELEKKMHGKDIVFVSLSSEANQGKWAAVVKEKGMTGIQLSSGKNRSFMDAYGITGIPYFILLDKEGKILKLNTTRPSDPKTLKMLLDYLTLS